MKRVSCVLALSILLAARASRADIAGSAEAEELFKQGRAALEQKDYATACVKLAESNRLERAVGTLISLAQCEEARGKIAGARQHWQEAADLADAMQDRLQRGPAAREKVSELEKRVPRLTVRAASHAPPNMTVKRDDLLLTAASFGSALPVDPGAHVLVVSAESREPKTFDVTLAEGDRKEIEVEPGAEIAKPQPRPEAPTSGAPQATTGSDNPEGGASTMRYAAYGLGGLGVVGLGVGTGLGVAAISKWNSAHDACPQSCSSTSQAKKDSDSARSQGDASTVAFVVGGAALAGGVVLWVLAPPSKPSANAVSVRIVPGFGGVSAMGIF